MAAPIGRLEFLRSFCSTASMSTQFLVFGGGGFWVWWGGGEVPILFLWARGFFWLMSSEESESDRNCHKMSPSVARYHNISQNVVTCCKVSSWSSPSRHLFLHVAEYADWGSFWKKEQPFSWILDSLAEKQRNLVTERPPTPTKHCTEHLDCKTLRFSSCWVEHPKRTILKFCYKLRSSEPLVNVSWPYCGGGGCKTSGGIRFSTPLSNTPMASSETACII